MRDTKIFEVEKYFSVKPWPHQERGLRETIESIAPRRWICVTSPTGGGKSKIMEGICWYALDNGMKVDLKVHRNLLLRQLIGVFQRASVPFGVRAATMPDKLDPHRKIQISSLPTEHHRCSGEGAKWDLHDADIVVVDEAHLQCGPQSMEILRRQAAAGACIVLVTATPIGMPKCDKLIIAGKNSELRRCGSLVRAIVKAPFEFDLSKVKREKTGEYAMGDVVKNCWSQAIPGQIYGEWVKANPEQKATLVFAPDVASSVWVAEHFSAKGVPSAHIDGSSVWFDGELKKDASGELRTQVMKMFEDGEIKVLSNRFVLREGIDCPFIHHLILACPFGSLKTYLQSVGRVLRRSPETPDHVLISDHGGNVHRHGSPNMDRDWEEIFWMTEEELADKQRDEERERAEDPPITCTNCGTIRKEGPRCPEPPIGCGQELEFRGKVIIQRSGKLRKVSESEMTKKYREKEKTAQQLWDEVYWALKNSKKPRALNFKQGRALFKRKHGYWPPFGLKNMPKDREHESQPVRELDRRMLL